MSGNTDMGGVHADPEVAEFCDLVSWDPQEPWEGNAAFKLYAQACAKAFLPEGQSFEAWSETATIEDFFEQVYAMQILPPELKKTTEMTDSKRKDLWQESARKQFESECEKNVLPLVYEAVEEDAHKWNLPIPSTSDRTSQEYQDFMKKAAKRKAYELYGYLSEVEAAEFEFRSGDKSSRIEQVGESLLDLMTTEESFSIVWYERPLRMNDAQWVEEKKRKIKKSQEEDEEQEGRKTEEEKEQERLQQEEDERETARAHALENKSDEVIEPRTITDPAVRKLYSTAVMILSYWWDHGVQKDDLSKLATLNERVKFAVSDTDYIPIAPSSLEFWVERVRVHLREFKQASGQQKYQKTLELAKDVVKLSNILRAYGFDWKIIANRNIQWEVLKILYTTEVEEVRKRRDALVKSIFEPYEEQKEFLEKFKFMLTIVKGAMDHKSPSALRVAIETLSQANQHEAPEINTGLGLKREDHCFPIGHLETIIDHGCDGPMVEAELRKLAVKLDMLGIPVDGLVAEFALSPPERQLIEKELLGLVANKEKTPEVQASYPQLTFGGATLLYEWCTDKKTVAWGKHNGLFFINQYGPDTAPIFRKENRPMPGYQDSRYENGLPPHEETSNGDNRIGNIKEKGSSTRKLYRSRDHIYTIYGVAFAEDPKRYPDNKYAYLTEHTKGDRRDSVYVLVGWDRYLNGTDIEKRWEPASEIRQRMPNDDADEWIMEQAVLNQHRFETFYKVAENPQLLSMQGAGSPTRTRGGRTESAASDGDGSRSVVPAGRSTRSGRPAQAEGAISGAELEILRNIMQRLEVSRDSDR
ncbi:hypothetical protein PMIN04_012918 [Paraphaeosphaeria minitans]|uniref:Uncharacterized protein n=1 Tax=Paraphaeosphaeria minitans TaxID=565426 RepID=A0A9P6GEQ8_9PLEO|nr:hypothetical protein PMIN01_08066 [Paraphaeosphaeria minitans]